MKILERIYRHMEIVTALIIAILIGVGGWSIKLLLSMAKRHRQHHRILDAYPDHVTLHTEEHEAIKAQLEYAKQVDIVQMRTQIISIYERAKNDGYITTHWSSQFWDLVDMYTKGGGNGLVGRIVIDMQEIPIKQ